jgi:beta-lactamase superfamily II metal-dependent hydrolase
MPNISNVNIEESFTDFIEYVSPKILITGNTKMTSEQLRENLPSLNEEITILETDKDGTVTITLDGKKLEVRSFTSEKELDLH